jgi:hypothetical protein
MPRTSRKDGILIIKTDKPYRMAVNGRLEERNTIICNDINSSAELAAFNLEQLMDVALFETGRKQDNSNQSPLEADDFFDKDCPTDEEIKDKATALEFLVRASKDVKISEIIQEFKGILNSGVIKCDGGASMMPVIWDTVDRNDKVKIVFWYSAFFVNPLQRLYAINPEMAKKSERGEMLDSEMQQELPVQVTAESGTKSFLKNPFSRDK